ncbi:PREDICTED: RNA-binding protein 41-like [Papilio polytes]|uniref:RNA-binding protein 41-like n=1 Tax=Papilio polytes TaxID=76194 RepID=UPI00067623A6|nr:PREDICTED: RNA-binding protein 41-like [Papilio polytes]
MCSELPKEFEKNTEVLPFTKYGLSTLQDFSKAEKDIQHIEWLKKVGLSNEEVKLYQENEAGLLDQRKKIESSVLKTKLDEIYNKINHFQAFSSSKQNTVAPSTSTSKNEQTRETKPKRALKFYPESHPMHELKEIEEDLFGHLRNDNIMPITKRRKLLRRLERKKEKIIAQQKQLQLVTTHNESQPSTSKPGSLWDVKDIPERLPECSTSKGLPNTSKDKLIGPKAQTMYTIKDNKILRLEPVQDEARDEFRAVDIVMPVNPAEEQLLEGTKMNLDDIKAMDRFKDYEPGIPSKVLYLKNISPAVSEERISLLFNQFLLENGGPIDVRLLSGRMRGQAFVTFSSENLAIKALDEVNGTILSGQPIIAQFGRNSNRIQDNR